MLMVFCGNDTTKVREEAFNEVAKYKAKGFSIEIITTEGLETGRLADAASGSSLFGGEMLYVIDTPSTDEEVYKRVVDDLQVLAESDHTFILIEGNLLAPEKKKISKYTEHLKELKAPATKRMNVFAIADLFSKKDKRGLWLFLNELRREGIPDEEIIGIIWWQLKALRLAALTASAEEAGMKDWPYNKAKQSLNNFGPDEITNLSDSLLGIYHQARAGQTELDIALERWVLSV